MRTGIVVGNGLVGACTALAMQRAGLQVTIIDPGHDEAAASHGNAGHLAVEQTQPLASRANVRILPRRLFSLGGPVAFPIRDVGSWLPFGLKLLSATSPRRMERGRSVMESLLSEAIGAWQRLTTRLNAVDLIRTDGHWMTWESMASAQRSLTHWQSSYKGPVTVAMASPAELEALCSRFNQKPRAAARFIGTGHITDLRSLRRVLLQAFLDAGGRLVANAVQEVGDAVVLKDGQTERADVVVVAAGIGASRILEGVCGPIPLIAERGYHVETAMDGSQVTPQGLPVVFDDRNVILAPFSTSLRLSGFTEFAQSDSPPDARKWQTLMRHAQALGLPMSPEGRCWMGSRPTLPDYLPAIGRHPRWHALFYAFGHNHLGVTLAARTAELVCHLIEGDASSDVLAALALERFQ